MIGGHVWSNTNGSYIQYDLVPVTQYPCTFAAWTYRTTNTIDDYNIIQLQQNDSGTEYIRLCLGDEGTSPTQFVVSAFNSEGSTAADYGSSTAETAYRGWSHAAGVFESATLRIGYMNGAFPGTSTTSRNWPTTPDSLSIGREMDSTPGDSFEGSIIWPAIWDVALTPSELQLLAQGFPPWEMRKESLRFCARLDGSRDEFRDMVTNAFPVPVSTEAGTVPIKLETGRIALPDFLINKRTYYIPFTDATVTVETQPDGTVIITDVNTTEEWADGDQDLVITGSGFV